MCIKKVEKVVVNYVGLYNRKDAVFLDELKRELKREFLSFVCFFVFIFKNIGRTEDGIQNIPFAWRTYQILDIPHTIALSRQNTDICSLCA